MRRQGNSVADGYVHLQLNHPLLQRARMRDDLDTPHVQRKVDDIVDSIRQHGYQPGWQGDEPITIDTDVDGEPRVTNGNKRLRALQQLDWDGTVPIRHRALVTLPSAQENGSYERTAGKGKPRHDAPDVARRAEPSAVDTEPELGQEARGDVDQGLAPGAPGRPRYSLTEHPAVLDDVEGLPEKVQDAYFDRVDALQRGERHSSTHALHGPLVGWAGTSLGGNRYRVVHRFDGDELHVLSAGVHDEAYDDAKRRKRHFAAQSRLSDESRVSVAEHIMEQNGHGGRTFDVPNNGRMSVQNGTEYNWDDDRKHPAAHYVHDALIRDGHDPERARSFRVYPDHWNLDQTRGQAITDGQNYVGTRDTTNELALLHECAHIRARTPEGPSGHGQAFQETAHRLYHRHLGPEAAGVFRGLLEASGSQKLASDELIRRMRMKLPLRQAGLRQVFPKPYWAMSKDEYEAAAGQGRRWVYHASESPDSFADGVRMSRVPQHLVRQRYQSGEHVEFAPGAGIGNGVYVAGEAHGAEGYGHYLHAFKVPMHHLEVPPESRGYRPDDVEYHLNSHDGALLTHDVAPEDVVNYGRVKWNGYTGYEHHQLRALEAGLPVPEEHLSDRVRGCRDRWMTRQASTYTVRLEHGRRRSPHQYTVPDDGPVSPAYLQHPVDVSYVKVAVPAYDEQGQYRGDTIMENEARITAVQMHRDRPGVPTSMVTKADVIQVEAAAKTTVPALYHGSMNRFEKGTVLIPEGRNPEGSIHSGDWVYATTSPDAARYFASMHDPSPETDSLVHIHRVEPIGPIESDQFLGERGEFAQGNYRAKALRVLDHQQVPGHWAREASMKLAMGQAGPNYQGLTFKYWKNYSSQHDEPHWLDGNDKHDSRSFFGMMAFRPGEQQSVGSLEFSPLHYGEGDREVHVHGIKVDPEHQRRGVGTALLRELERHYPDVPVHHGLRTQEGADLTERFYGRPSEQAARPGRSERYGDAPYEGGWTLGGKPWDPQTKQVKTAAGSTLPGLHLGRRQAGRYSDALENRRALHEDAAARGHDMRWKRQQVDDKPTNSFHGECRHCGATMSVGPSWSSTDHPNRDARSASCTGPGTKWQSDMQRELASERFQKAISQFGQDIKDSYDREWLRDQRLGRLDLHQVRVLNPTTGHDPDLFDGEHLKPEVRTELLHRWTTFCARHGLRDWSKWACLWFTGGEASEWSGPGSSPNGDFDMQVGIRHAEFVAANPSWAGTPEEISQRFNDLFWTDLNDHHFTPGRA